MNTKKNRLWIFTIATILLTPYIIFNSNLRSTFNKSAVNYHDRITVDEENTQVTLADIDGNVYQTVFIGERVWMAENLKTTKYNDGSPILTRLSDSDWRNTSSGAYTIYPHDDVYGINSESDMLETYGALYNWYAVENDNLCPAGWYVPGDDEWAELIDYIESINSINIGNQLKSCRQDGSPLGGECAVTQHPRWNSHKIHHGIDKFGFTALPGGIRNNQGSFNHIGSQANWWSSAGGTAAYAWSWRIAFNSGDIYTFMNHKASGFSVRCVREIE